MSLPSFDSASPDYRGAAEELRDNPGQWAAYESKGHCVTLAGPGSGKTKTLVVKIARMLHEDVTPPQGLACVTFSNECAHELKRRLSALGVKSRGRVFIGTVHSFCLKQIVFPFARLAGIGLPTEVKVASVGEQDIAFEKALGRAISADENPWKWKMRFGVYRRTHVDRDHPSWQEDTALATLVETYEGILRAQGFIDFDDMVLIGLRLIESFEWVRKVLHAKFPIFVVDEYQDLGLPLHRMVLSLCSSAGLRLFAVGDPDQSIYGFTGAQPHLLMELANKKNVEEIRLPFNYRSCEMIVRACEVALGEPRGYQAKREGKGLLLFHECPNGIQEQAASICESIIPHALSQGYASALGEIAVLYPTSHQGDVIAAAAKESGLKFVRIDANAPYRKTPLTLWLEECALWCVSGWRKRTPRLSDILGSWRNLNRKIRDEPEIHRRKVMLVEHLYESRDTEESLRDWLVAFEKACLKECLFLDPSMRGEQEMFRALMDATDSGNPLGDADVSFFAGLGGSPDHLNLITLHSAKSREFDVVVLMGMDQGVLPHWSADTEEKKKEPRRLFYVGLSRARFAIHLTYSGWWKARSGARKEQGPSEFLLEVKEKAET